MSQSKDVSNYRRNRKLNLIKVLGGKCQICGFNLFPAALEFHHEDPTQKEYGVATKGTCHNLEADLNEIKKCFLLCANCHRGVHSGFYSNPKEKVFDENIANELIQNRNQQNEKTINYCVDCGKEIDRGATRCVICQGIKNRKVSNRPTREELKQLIRNYPFVQIGRQFGVSDNTIRKWCDAYNLPRKSSIIKQYNDEEWSKI
jgi:hypothetical protein